MSRFDRIKAIVSEALDLPPDARSALLDSTCGDDDELRDEVESILRASDDLPDLLATGGVSDALGHTAPPREIQVGEQLGHYEIVERVGSGGMGVVYRARDTRLGRTVAIKVLSHHLSRDADYRRRLEREARIISSLQHPGVCTLYDIGRHDEVEYLVMEFLDGETLSERLTRRDFTLDEALGIGIEIADALDHAHRAGIIHRDLKPGNIMLTVQGVKLLDFGVAKPGARPFVTSAEADGRPETEAASLTHTGTLIGTVPYMAPEQLDGKPVDSRADLFALGAVLYELVTGRRAFEGSGASLVAAIMTLEPPPVYELSPDAPESLEPILRACLTKQPENRIQTAHDVKLQLTWALETHRRGPLRPRRRPTRPVLARLTPWALGLLVAVAVLWQGARWLGTSRIGPADGGMLLTRFEVAPPSGVRSIQQPHVSPDGATLAFIGTDSTGERNVWLRDLRYVEPRQLPETEGATSVAWAPDSHRLAFFDDGLMLKIVDTVSGAVRTVCEVSEDRGTYWTHEAVWTESDHIIFDRGLREPLFEVPITGGAPTPCSTIDTARDELGHIRPSVRGATMTFLALRDGAPRTLAVAKNGTHAYLEQAESGALPIAEDLLLYLRGSTLVLRRFDADAGGFLGDPTPVAERVVALSRQLGEFSASRNGVLAYRASARMGVDLTWYDRSGAVSGVALEAADYRFAALSHDGRIAVARPDMLGNRDIWLQEPGQLPRRLTFREGNDNMPVWSPDGEDVFYLATVPDTSWILRTRADGTGTRDTLLTSRLPVMPFAVSPDGAHLVYTHMDRHQGATLRVLSTDASYPPRVLPGPGGESSAGISPDGRWIIYMSPSTGRNEIYLQTFPAGESRRQLTVEGGRSPRWSRDGREILFLRGDGIFSIDVTYDSGQIDVSRPRRLFGVDVHGGAGTTGFAVTADGERFLVPVSTEEQTSVPVTVVTGWRSSISVP